jgi:hypothetical protein
VGSIHLDAASGQLLVVSDPRTGAGSLYLWSCGRHLSSLPSPTARLRMASSVQLRPPRALLDSDFTCVAVPRYGSSTFFFGGDSAGDVRVLTATPVDERPSLDRGIVSVSACCPMPALHPNATVAACCLLPAPLMAVKLAQNAQVSLLVSSQEICLQ